jgi:ABC-type antimicrobial peptide transport system permease subunit
VLNLRSQVEQIDRLHAQELLFARLSAVFGALALALACVGLYGLLSHSVARRTGEIGLRMALGAPSGQVQRMILGESLTLVLRGVVVGSVAAVFSSRLIATMLFGLTPADPATYAAVALGLGAVALLASMVPARRASRIDPIIALRIE